jgi:hypothetical protein
MESKMVDFINGGGVIQVNNAADMKVFIGALKKYGIYDSLIANKLHAADYEKISFYRHLAEINNKRHNGGWLRPNFPIYFEFQYGKGISFYWIRKEVIDWYGDNCFIKVSEI